MSREERSERLYKRLEREAQRQRTEYIKELELEVSLRKEATCLDQRIIQELKRELDALKTETKDLMAYATAPIRKRVAQRLAMQAEIVTLKSLANKVVGDALEYADVHPCDVHNDEVKARYLSENMRALYEALKNGH
ncbi:hypothetical protein hairong_087 [Pseudomonas phage hairong]|nr:hypothetical protein hairong_087 [Pseudomonas phage hairong]